MEQLLLVFGDDLLVLDDLFLLDQDLEHLLLISDDLFLARDQFGKTENVKLSFKGQSFKVVLQKIILPSLHEQIIQGKN